MCRVQFAETNHAQTRTRQDRHRRRVLGTVLVYVLSYNDRMVVSVPASDTDT